MLNIAGIQYDQFQTNSATFVEEWVNLYEKENFPYTDIVCVGGDGLFSQLINAMNNSSKRSEFLQIPIAFLPGGSQNAICCDLGGKNLYQAGINIIRRNIIKSDIMKIRFKNHKEPIFGTTLQWGLTGDIVHKGEKWRRALKSSRYAVCGAKTFLCSCSIK